MRRILFITCNNIYDKSGNGGVKGSKKNLHLLRSCKENDVTVFTIQPQEKPAPPAGAMYVMQPKSNLGMLVANILGQRRCYPWQLSGLKKLIAREKFDFIFIDGSLLGGLKKFAKNSKTIAFFHNIEADYTYNKLKNDGIQFLPAYLCTVKNERIAATADKVLCLNSRDAAIIESKYGRKPDGFWPVTFEDQFDESKVREGSKDRILFVGSLFTPNQKSIEWFMKNVMTRLPDIHLDIVGKGFETKKQEYESAYKNVSVHGFVENVEDYYYSHSIVVMPILYGAGMKVKTAEAMMYGRTIIASDEALEGYDVEGVEGVYRCNSEDEYVKTIQELTSRSLPEYNKDVRKLFLDKYETKCLYKTMEDILA